MSPIRLVEIDNEEGWGIVVDTSSFSNKEGDIGAGNQHFVIGEVLPQANGSYRWVYYGRIQPLTGSSSKKEGALAVVLAHLKADGGLASYRGTTGWGHYSIGQVSAPSPIEAQRLLFILAARLPAPLQSLWQQEYRVEIWNKKCGVWDVCRQHVAPDLSVSKK